jgi:ABC-type dipeptide/oligopeptide/nickel transport system permease subunit
MRLKLVLAAAALAALVGAGSCIALVLGVFSAKALSSPSLLVTSTLLLPVATIVFAAIFVYRHTARRRKLQALLTALIATLLTLTFFILASIVSARRVQPYLALYRTQGVDDEANMFVEIHA